MQSDWILTTAPPPADHRARYGEDANQFIDLYLPPGNGPHPLLIFVHGGFWRAKYDLAHAGHLCHALKLKGIAAANVEFRRVGNPGGGWPGTFEDVRAAYRFLAQPSTEFDFDQHRTVIAGHSAGGQLAMCLAAHEPTIHAVVSLAGVLDLKRAWELHLSHDAVAEFLGGPPERVPDHYKEASPIALRMEKVKQAVIHGKADDIVPYDMAQEYYGKKKKAGEAVELITPAGAGHFELVDPKSKQWPAVEAAISRFLGS